MAVRCWQAHLGSTQVDTSDIIVTEFISCSLGENIFKIDNVCQANYMLSLVLQLGRLGLHPFV